MSLQVLFAASPSDWPAYEGPLRRAFSRVGLDVDLRRDCDDPAKVAYLIYAPDGPLSDFSPYTGAKAVLSLWAGVEKIIGNKTLTQPLARLVDPGLTEGMVEWVTGHVLRHHLGLDAQLLHQDGIWHPVAPPLARNRQVSVLGLGALGAACARALAALRFQVTGWSRTAKTLDGIRCLSGENGLTAALEHGEITVLLLPLTTATENLINATSLAHLPQGAVLINPGRGALIDDDALLAALNNGNLGHATLDVFRTEPLPAGHAFWANPRVTVTPHIASQTRPETAAEVIAENIRRGEAGERLVNLVDRHRGY